MPIRVVLVNPTHPGNIGATARAMKNMGLRELHLVGPEFFPHPEATARASSAADVLETARVHEKFEDAIELFFKAIGKGEGFRHGEECSSKETGDTSTVGL
jgi:tRNA C32,U32 (ribose-2'-O)-methylase TrmJ